MVYGNVPIFLWINENLTPQFGQLARVLSAFGESIPMGMLVFLAFFISVRSAFAVGFSWLLGSCFSWLFKFGLASEALRPEKYFLNLGQVIQTVSGVKVHHYHSFPSGHTLTAFTIAFMVPFLFKNLNVKWMSLLWIAALFCGISRMVLAQHWPIDVLGGMAFGTITALLTVWIFAQLPDYQIFKFKLSVTGFRKIESL